MSSPRALWIKRTLMAAFAAAGATGLVVALMPRPVPVDMATISRGALRVTVDEEGKSRIKDVYIVSAPVAGKLLRSPLSTGQEVKADQTIVASIEPAAPPFMDLRTEREVAAEIKSAEAAVELAEAEVRVARSEMLFAESELSRATRLLKTNAVPERTVEKARMELDTRRAALARAEAGEQVRRRDLERATARRTAPDDPAVATHGATCCLPVISPVTGRVLKIILESEQVVAQGTPLVEIGDPEKLEFNVELLSADAVRVAPGAAATIESWGGEPIMAKVHRIDPAGFTKISALGIEEQRVRVVLLPAEPSSRSARLGHDYRVFVRISIEERSDALLVPLGALFRKGESWAVYAVEDGRAQIREVQLGHRNTTHAELIGGLSEGARIVLHPSDRVSGGVGIVERRSGG